jgi:opacity protein-like surface antigen
MSFSKYGIASLVFAAGSVFAADPAGGWYAGGMLGVTKAQGTNLSITNPYLLVAPVAPVALTMPPLAGLTLPIAGTVHGKLSYNLGANIAGQVGYRCNKIRYEGELLLNSNSYSKLVVGPYSITTTPKAKKNSKFRTYPPLGPVGLRMKGTTSIFAGIFNAYYDFYDEDDSDTKFVPYLGLGIGYAYVQNTLDFYYDYVKINPKNNKASSTTPIAQGILGMDYFVSNTTSLGLDFRYYTTKKIKSFDAKASAASINFVVNYSFAPSY